MTTATLDATDLHLSLLRLEGSPEPSALSWALSPEDEEKSESLARAEDRLRLAASRALLRHSLAQVTDIPPEEQVFVRHCDVCGGRHGKQRLVPVGVDPDSAEPAAWDTPQTSISHSGDIVLVAMHRHRPVGVDVEAYDGTAFTGFDEFALTPQEAAQLASRPEAERPAARTRWWVRKEAILKATGHGLFVEPSALTVSPPEASPELLAWSSARAPQPEVTVVDLSVADGYEAAVAVLGHAPVHPVIRSVSADELVRA